MARNDNITGKGQKLFFLFLLFLVLFIFPMISIFNKGKLIFGLPVLFVYLFFAWFVMIGLLYSFLKDKKDNTESNE
jgi:peptidoglycan/LPS O-acetylase OafA/YrhL